VRNGGKGARDFLFAMLTAALGIAMWLIVAMMLASCAHTELRTAAGKVLLSSQADLTGANYHYHSASEDVSFAGNVNHSAPTAAGGAAVSQIASGIGTAAMGVGTAVSTSGLPAVLKH
jgi:ABC-type lipoprotein release transport system permease subunit